MYFTEISDCHGFQMGAFILSGPVALERLRWHLSVYSITLYSLCISEILTVELNRFPVFEIWVSAPRFFLYVKDFTSEVLISPYILRPFFFFFFKRFTPSAGSMK